MHGLGESITIIETVDCHAAIQQQRLIRNFLMKICPFYF